MGAPERSSLFCPVRQIWTADLPEERIRQKVLYTLVHQLSYPLGSIGVEKALRQLPHLAHSSSLPDRRIDILCFHKDSPLLLIECKSISLSIKTLRQMLGYNLFIKAPFVAATNGQETLFGWIAPQTKELQFISFIPPYSQLIEQLKR